jgi:hypothetical protein
LPSLLVTVIFATVSNREKIYYAYVTSKTYAEASEKFKIECSKLASAEDIRRCFERVLESAREPQRAEEDLRAQKEMAQWAYWMVIASGFIGVTIVGIAGVGVYWAKQTWDLQRAATTAATQAADAAVKASDASIEANALQRDMFITENRPWLCLESISVAAPLVWEGGHARMKFKLCLQNFGRSVATDVHIRTTIDVDPESALWCTAKRLEGEEQAAQYTALATGFNVIPGKPYVINIEVGIPENAVSDRLAHGVSHIAPHFIGYVRYAYQAGQIRFGFVFNFCIFHIDRNGELVLIGPTHGNVARENLRLVPFPPSHTIFGG